MAYPGNGRPKGQKNRDHGFLTFKQYRCIINLLKFDTKLEAARATDIKYETLLNWFRKPKFAAVYREQIDRMFQQALLEVQKTVSRAFTKALHIMDEGEKQTDQLRAAQIIIDSSIKGNEITVLRQALARYEHIERLLKERGIHGEMGDEGQADQQPGGSARPSLGNDVPGGGEGPSGEAPVGLQPIPGEAGEVHAGGPGVHRDLEQDRRGDGEPQPPTV